MNQDKLRRQSLISYGVFYLMGILSNAPSQFFIVASDYWMWKFRDPKYDSEPGSGGPRQRTHLQKYFMSSASILFQVAPSIFLLVTAWWSSRLPLASHRVNGALGCLLILFSMNAALAPLNTDSLQSFLFGLGLFFALAVNVCTSVALVSLCHLVVRFPLSHYAALQSGTPLSGILACIVQITVISLSRTPWIAGLAFFSTGVALTGAALALFGLASRLSECFVYRVNSAPTSLTLISDVGRLRVVLSKAKLHLLALGLTSGCSAILFPGLVSLVVSEEFDNGLGSSWAEVYFVPVATFLTHYVCDFIGREVATRVQKPENPWAMLVLACLRLLLLPLLLLCNMQPRKNLPVVFCDGTYVIFIVILGITHGFVTNICILSSPKIVADEDKSLMMVLNLLTTQIIKTICSCFSIIIIHLL